MTEEQEARMNRLAKALAIIMVWADAYPLNVFPEPDEEYCRQAGELLQAGGLSLDRLSAATARHVVTGVARIAREALG
jgi:hypothetical protein